MGKGIADAIEPFVQRGCRHCTLTLAKMREEGPDPRKYGTMSLDTGKPVMGYVLRPDRNGSGCITSWHICQE